MSKTRIMKFCLKTGCDMDFITGKDKIIKKDDMYEITCSDGTVFEIKKDEIKHVKIIKEEEEAGFYDG